jgi:hypothetical protein
MDDSAAIVEPTCDRCGERFVPPEKTGRGPLYCGSTCRQKTDEHQRVQRAVELALFRHDRALPEHEERRIHRAVDVALSRHNNGLPAQAPRQPSPPPLAGAENVPPFDPGEEQ